ncbi:hypothetical protein NMY22_g16231 [Coprinellus aureogranulatus]|nr:hypothetical protein NMY22_g16231 [Coprinellus aureogranulatus]
MHAENCWGAQIVADAIKVGQDIGLTHESLKDAKLRDGSLFATFKRWEGQDPVMFRLKQHSYKETRRPFVAVAMHFKHKGKPLCMLLNIVEVTVSHSGANLASAFAQILEEFGILHKKGRVQCFTHIVNLVMKIILRQFDPQVKKMKADKGDLSELAQRLEEDLERDETDPNAEDIDFDDDEADDDSTAGLGDVEAVVKDAVEGMEKESRTIWLILTKLQKLAYAIKNLPTKIQPRWEAILDDIANSPEGKAAGITLRDLELSDRDWEIVRELCDCLKIFKDITLKFSSDTPSLPSVIPAMDRVDSARATAILSCKYHPAITASLKLRKDLLNKYYSLTNMLDVYRIAMVLHPSYKLWYLFEKAGWEDKWVKEAVGLMHKEFNLSYSAYDAPPQQESSQGVQSDDDDMLSDTKDELEGQAVANKLDRYLAAPRVHKVKNALQWWNENCHVYPRLFQMARDYLMVPVCGGRSRASIAPPMFVESIGAGWCGAGRDYYDRVGSGTR